MLLDLVPDTFVQGELDLGSDEDVKERTRLMKALDSSNDRWGRGVVHVASSKVKKNSNWSMKQERLSPQYTTRLKDVLVVGC